LGKGLVLFATLVSVPSVVGLAQQASQNGNQLTTQDIIDKILTFIYSLGHLIGQRIVKLVVTIIPSLEFPSELVDPIGVLAILTIFLAVAAIAKKLVWIVVIAGWALILVRLILVIIQS
jgi:hypothetical protein